jgi:hypothetical protein
VSMLRRHLKGYAKALCRIWLIRYRKNSMATKKRKKPLGKPLPELTDAETEKLATPTQDDFDRVDELLQNNPIGKELWEAQPKPEKPKE